MWGEEGERIQQQRLAAQRQYAEDLRKQIEDRQRQSKSPGSYSRPQETVPPSRPAPLLQQQPQGLISQPRTQIRSQLSASPRLEALPDLAPVTSGPSPDAIRFADRLNWLESSVDQHQSVLRSASESASRIEKTSIPSLTDGIEQLKAAIDRITQVDLPGRLRPLEEENQKLEERIASASSEYSKSAEELKQNLRQISSSFATTQSQFSEFSNSVKSTILEFKSEIAQARDSHDSLSQRISQAESKAAQTEETLRTIDAALSSFENTAADGMSSAQQQINSLVSSSSLQIAQDLKTESEERDRLTADLHAKTEEVNQKAVQGVSYIQTSINDLAISFKQSLNALSSSVRDALESTRNQSDQYYKDLSARLDELMSKTESNFNTVQNESVATLESLNEHASRSREELESALTQECETRKQNEIQIVQRYDNFKSLIVNEMQLQTARMEELSEQARQKVVKRCNEGIVPLKNEIAQVRDLTRTAELLPQKVADVEKQIGLLDNQLVENVGALGQQSSRIVGAIEKMRGDSEQALDHMHDRLKILEDNASKPEYATRAEVTESFNRLSNEFDGRIQDIERQIGVIFSSLSDLTMSSSSHPTTKEPGASLLDQLANQDDD